MKTFATDKLEYLTFQLSDSDETYKIPLASSMSFATIRALSEANAKPTEEERTAAALEVQYGLLRDCIGDKADGLPMSVVTDIFAAWREASESRATLGE